MTEQHKGFGCNCVVCREWRQRIYDSGRWPRPRFYNGQEETGKGKIADAVDPHGEWKKCRICRQQNSFSGVGHWAWHRFCRAELNPVALISRIEQQRLGVGGDAIVQYVVAVTGMDLTAARAALADEGTAPNAEAPKSEGSQAAGAHDPSSLSSVSSSSLSEGRHGGDVEGYGNARCICGHLSSRHACDHENSDYSCSDCACESFATSRRLSTLAITGAPQGEPPAQEFAQSVAGKVRAEMRRGQHYIRPDSGVLRFCILPTDLNVLLKAVEVPPKPFPVYQAVEWQCRYVFPDQRCCIREKQHNGEHKPAEIARADTGARPPSPLVHFWTVDPSDKNRCAVCGDGPWGVHRFQQQPDSGITEAQGILASQRATFDAENAAAEARIKAEAARAARQTEGWQPSNNRTE